MAAHWIGAKPLLARRASAEMCLACTRHISCQQFIHDSRLRDFSVREAGVSTFVRVRQAMMVDAECRQQGGVQVVDVDDIFDRRVTEVVRRAMHVAGLEASTREPQ